MEKQFDIQKIENVIYCVIVIGFHHKIGAQIEFVYPENVINENI